MKRYINTNLRHILPNQLEIAYQNKIEAIDLYREIFEEQVYLRHGLTLNDNDCVVDIGANIGLFSLFVHSKCSNAMVYAFEPAPPLFEILQFNTFSCRNRTKIFKFGLSNKNSLLEFTFYPKSPAMSSFYANKEEEKKVLASIMNHQLKEGIEGMEELIKHADDFFDERLKREIFLCELKTISSIISSESIKRIDFLKIDAQKSELDIIQGINSEDWQKINQITMEVHDINNRLNHIVELLKNYGFSVEIEKSCKFHDTALSNLYARRK